MERATYFILSCLMLVLAGCHQFNVKEGSPDYPKINPTPTHSFKFQGTIDPKLHIQFKTYWFASNNDCYFMLSNIEGASSPYWATSPLDYILIGNHFEASVATDGVLPGRCGWVFGGVSAIKTDLQNHALPAAGTNVIATNSPPLSPGKSPNGKSNFDCQPKPGSPYVGCIPQNYKDTLWWYPETTEMEANFYY